MSPYVLSRDCDVSSAVLGTGQEGRENTCHAGPLLAWQSVCGTDGAPAQAPGGPPPAWPQRGCRSHAGGGKAWKETEAE